MKKAILPKDYPDLDVRKMQINLIQSSDRILDSMSEKSSQEAEDFLINLGVNVWKNVRVTGYDGSTVTTNTDLTFNSATVIWTAGVQGALPAGIDSNAIIPRAERLKVNEFNQVEGYDNIFAIGDIAAMVSEQNPKGHPMMAQPAMQQGKWLGENIVNKINKKSLKPFVYNDKGSMATIGRNKAVVDLPKFHFSGVFAWFVWIFVHLFSLIGFKNKAVVLTNWIYNYIRLDREGRLIIRPFKKKDVTSFVADEV
jgi:NADH dehydrogenase